MTASETIQNPRLRLRGEPDPNPIIPIATAGRITETATTAEFLPWRSFAALCSVPNIRDVKDGPYFLAATLTGPRRKANVGAVHAVVLDLDGKTLHHHAVDLQQRLSGLLWCAWTTHSSTRAEPRWRVVLPLARNLPPDDLPALTQKVATALGLDADAGSGDPGRGFYLPACPQSRRHEFQFLEGEGYRLDPDMLPNDSPSKEGFRGGQDPNEPRRDISSRFIDQNQSLVAAEALPLLFEDADIGVAVAEHLGLPVAGLRERGRTGAFRSPLRDDQHPSAAMILQSDGRGEVVLRDFGLPVPEGVAPEAVQCFNLARLRMMQAYGRVLRKGEYGPLLLLWRARLLAEIGLLSPEPAPMHPCPADFTESERKIYDGVRRLFEIRNAVIEWWCQPAAMSRAFLAAWCGVSEATADRAKRKLMQAGVISMIGVHEGKRGSCGLFRLGYHRPAKRGIDAGAENPLETQNCATGTPKAPDRERVNPRLVAAIKAASAAILDEDGEDFLCLETVAFRVGIDPSVLRSRRYAHLRGHWTPTPSRTRGKGAVKARPGR